MFAAMPLLCDNNSVVDSPRLEACYATLFSQCFDNRRLCHRVCNLNRPECKGRISAEELEEEIEEELEHQQKTPDCPKDTRARLCESLDTVRTLCVRLQAQAKF